MNEVRQQWELRAEKSSANLSGVLYKGLSEQANSALNEWHGWIVRSVFLSRLPACATILDLGCGYGRVAKVVASVRPDVRLIGQDLAMTYCRMFADVCGPCVLADAAALPFRKESFDGVIAMTSLMYVPRTDIAHVIGGLRETLRPGGVILSVDPGYEVQHLIAGVRRHRSPSPTGGFGFRREEYQRFFEQSGFAVVGRGGNPHLSRALLIPAVATARAPWIGRALARRGQLDAATCGYDRFALHRWVVAQRTEV